MGTFQAFIVEGILVVAFTAPSVSAYSSVASMKQGISLQACQVSYFDFTCLHASFTMALVILDLDS